MIETGEILPNEEIGFLRTWWNADMEGAEGLSEPDIHLLKVLGVINLPETSYNPQTDEDINQALRREE